MPQPIPYLGFNGNCAEAMRFYEQVLGGKIEVMMTGGESPMADQMPREFHDRIIHARLALPDGGFLFGGDAPAHLPYPGIHGVSLALNYDTVERARQVFDALAAGGMVTMPMQSSFWAKAWGMVIDKYGAAWIINGESQPF